MGWHCWLETQHYLHSILLGYLPLERLESQIHTLLASLAAMGLVLIPKQKWKVAEENFRNVTVQWKQTAVTSKAFPGAPFLLPLLEMQEVTILWLWGKTQENHNSSQGLLTQCQQPATNRLLIIPDLSHWNQVFYYLQLFAFSANTQEKEVLPLLRPRSLEFQLQAT